MTSTTNTKKEIDSESEQKRSNQVTELPEGMQENPRDETELPYSHAKIITNNRPGRYVDSGDLRNHFLGDELTNSFLKYNPDDYFARNGRGKDTLDEVSAMISNTGKQLFHIENVGAGIATFGNTKLGQWLNTSKPVVKENNISFTDWLESLNTGYKNRSLQKFMKIARVIGIERYAFFGTERNEKIATILEKMCGKDFQNCPEPEDPVGWLFRKFQISLNVDSEYSEDDNTDDGDDVSADRATFDLVVLRYRIEEAAKRIGVNLDNVDLDQEKLRLVVKTHPEPDQMYVETLCWVIKTNGDYNSFIENLASKDSSGKCLAEIDPEIENRHFSKSLESTQTRISKIFVGIMSCPKTMQKIDTAVISETFENCRKILEERNQQSSTDTGQTQLTA